MMPTNRILDDATRAVLDGTPVDWGVLESSGDLETQRLIEQLRVLSAVAGVHRADARPALPARPADDAPRWGHLRLLERVGVGAFGEVFRAWDTRLDREVALKLLPAGAAPRDGSSPIIHEGRLLARVRHPNVATIYGAELIDDRIGLWMEFIHGRTLDEQVRTGLRFNAADAVRIGLDLCAAVSAVHAAGLLHRDIKTTNVMRADDGRIVLMDFGTGLDQADAGLEVAGTPLYLAPEVLAGQPATVRSDVYGVGVVLYHLLTGAYPVRANTLAELRGAHERGERMDLLDVRPELPAALAAIVRRAIEADPARRYGSCDAIAADLAAFARRPGRRWRAAAVAAVAVMGVITWVGWWSRGQTPPEAAGGAARAGTGVAGSAATAAWNPAERPVIAVLPFTNHLVEPESDLIVDGLTYELIHNLAVIDGLEVKSATSSFALKEKGRDLAEVGRQLGVNLVLEGSVQGSSGQWRVHVQLVRVAGDTPLWTRKFDRLDQGVFEVQDEVALAIVNELRLKFGGGQRRYTLDPQTQTLYLKARALTAQRGSASAEAAVNLFEQVLLRDPTFAPAHAGLAEAYSFLSQDLPDVGGMPPARALELMRPAAERALALDPLLAEAHAAMGILHSRVHRWEDANQAFLRAIDLNPSLSHVYADYSLTTLLPLGRFDEADALLSEALRRDPLSAVLLRELGIEQLTAGRYDEAIRTFEATRAIDPELPYVDMLLARTLSLAGRTDEAMPFWEANRSVRGLQHWMAYAFVRAGRRAEVEQMAAQERNPYRLAIFHTALGNLDRAIDALDRAADESPQRVVRLLVYPEMAALRDHPRFAAIRAKFRLP